MFRRTLPVALAICLAATTLAQDEEQQAKPKLERGAVSSTGQRADQFRMIARQLKLDDEQRAEYQKIADKYRENATPNKSQRMRELVGELREADEAGDSARVAELRQEISALRRGGNEMKQFLAEIEPILREDQLPVLEDLKQRYGRRGQKNRGKSIAGLRALKKELDLDAEQVQQWDERFGQLQEEVRKNKGGGDSMELIQQIMEAAEAGDEERVKELRDQLPNPREQSAAAIDTFLTDIRAFLHDEQIEIVERFEAESAGGGSGSGTDLRACFRFIGRLDLDRTQRDALTELRKEAQQAERSARRDKDEQANLNAQYQQRIRELLSSEQAAEFDRWLESQGGDGKARGGRRQGGMRGRTRGAKEEP